MKLVLCAFILLLVLQSARSLYYSDIIFEERDTGVDGKMHFDLSVEYDCNRTLVFHVDSAGYPVTGATVRVLYTERYTPLLTMGVTDGNGNYKYTLISDPSHMRGLFIVVADQIGFRTREAHFTLPLCGAAAQQPKNPSIPQANNTPAVQKNQSVSIPLIFNDTGNSSMNESGNLPKQKKKLPCCPSFILLFLMIPIVYLHSQRKP